MLASLVGLFRHDDRTGGGAPAGGGGPQTAFRSRFGDPGHPLWAGSRRRPEQLGIAAGRPAALLEALEARTLLTAFAWTAQEVYLAELVNRARIDPTAEGVRLQLDLAAGLSADELLHLHPQEPLALNPALTLAARLHALDMAQRGFFDHINPDGLSPTDRVQAQGYAGSAGENIAAGYTSIDDVHAAWMASVGHRKNVLSLQLNFDDTFHYDEFGPGIALTDIAPSFDFYVEEFGIPQASPAGTYVLGVVYTDNDHNNFYGFGEGAANVRIDIAAASAPGTVIGTYTTDAAGNYQIPMGAGTYLVRFTDLATGWGEATQVTVVNDNVKADARTGDFTNPGAPPSPDDHADSGQWAQATAIDISPTTGRGGSTGVIDPATDTDLFVFTAAAAGSVNVSVLTPSGALEAQVRVYDSSHAPIAVGTPSGSDGADATVMFTAQAGGSYFVQVESRFMLNIGAYTVMIDGPVDTPYRAGAGQAVFATSTAAGQLTTTTINGDSHPIVIQQVAGGNGWVRADLQTSSGSPGVSGNVVTWADPKDGLVYAAARSDSGLILYRSAGNGIWTYRNLTSEVPGSQLLGNNITVFMTTDQLVYIAGLITNGDLVFYRQTGTTNVNGYAWSFINIAETQLRPQGLVMPAFTGQIISYTTSWDGLNVAGLDADGRIKVVWWAPGLSQWRTDDLSAITGAPPLTGGLTAYLTSWDGINLAGIDGSGKVSVTWWVPAFGGDWRTTNLSDAFNGPTLAASSVTSYVSSWGGLNIAGISSQGRVIIYWWSPGMTDWQVTPISNLMTNPPLPVGHLTGHATAPGSLNIFGANSDGDVIRYHWEVGGQWAAQDLTTI